MAPLPPAPPSLPKAFVAASVGLLLVVAVAIGVGYANWKSRSDASGVESTIEVKTWQELAAERRAADLKAYRANQVVLKKSASRSPKILLLGDSMMGGFGATDPSKSWVSRLRFHLKEQGLKPVMVGRNEADVDRGVQIADMTPLVSTVPGAPFDLVILELGSNNGTNPAYNASDTKRDYLALIRETRRKSPKAQVLCIGPWGSPTDAGRVSSQIYEACVEEGGKFHPVRHLFDRRGNRYLDRKMPDGTPIDNFHPTDQGYREFAEVVINAIRIER